MGRPIVRIFPLFVLLLLAACGGGGSTGPVDDNDDGDNGNDTPTRQILENPSFSTDIQEIFNRRGCTAAQCHGSTEEAGLDLRAGASYAELVNVVAFSDADFFRVEPGDAQNSYLVMKLEGRQTAGETMPLDGAPLDNIDLTNIRNWIDNGAPEN